MLARECEAGKWENSLQLAVGVKGKTAGVRQDALGTVSKQGRGVNRGSPRLL